MAQIVTAASRIRIRGIFTGLAAFVAVTVGGTMVAPAASAAPPPDPPNMMGVPAQVPQAIDRMVPPAPFPKLRIIPRRARAAGFSHRTLEFREAVLPSPTGDPIYDHWPADLAAQPPGRPLATRNVTTTARPLAVAPISRATQVKFRSTDAVGQPSFGTATLIEPTGRAPVRGARPVVVNNLPIDSLGTKCNPGYTLAHGISFASNTTDLIPPLTQLALARGYAVLIPDHQGPRMAYAEPTVAGHVILDAIRAIGQLYPNRYRDSRVAMAGYSGGAIATSGAATLAGTYAPEVAPRLVGAALGGVPADFRMLLGSMNANLAAGLLHAATFGIARERTEILPMANHFAEWLATSPLKDACFLLATVAGGTFWPMQLMANDPDPFRSPVAERIFEVTSMNTRKSLVPLYIYQGAQEWWIPAAGARNLYRAQCRLGATAEYHDYLGEHVTTAVAGFPGAIDWLDRRLRGQPAREGCR